MQALIRTKLFESDLPLDVVAVTHPVKLFYGEEQHDICLCAFHMVMDGRYNTYGPDRELVLLLRVRTCTPTRLVGPWTWLNSIF